MMEHPVTITDRNVTLSGLFADGSPFSFDLWSTLTTTADYFGPGSLVTVTRVAPITMAGDYDHNGTVDAADYLVWRNTLGQSGSSLAADGNRNGAVDTGDYNLWGANFGRTFASAAATGQTSVPIPEPSSLAITLAAVAWIGALRRSGCAERIVTRSTTLHVPPPPLSPFRTGGCNLCDRF
jgi:hypothetical protein